MPVFLARGTSQRTPFKAALLLVASISAGCARTTAAEGPAAIFVNWDETHQTIQGFGGTMGWIHPGPKIRDEVFDLLFTRLGASVLRIRALGGEGGDEQSLETVNDNDDPNIFNWSRFPVASTEAKNAAIIRAAVARGVKTVIAASWSPPGWMKDSGKRAGGGCLKPGPSILAEYAELWAAYVIGMKREFRIDVPCVSIQNEPDLTYYYPTCRFEPDSYAKAMSSVEKRFRRERLKTLVVGPDTCRIHNLPQYVGEMEKLKVSPRTPILTHLYDLSVPFHRVERDPGRWREARELAHRYKRPLWLIETANYLSYGVEPASYEEAIAWAQKIHHALVSGDCEVVCYWSLFFDKKGEALVYCPETGADEYEITPKFYTSMNYYRFVRPGMVRCTASSADGKVLVSAFKSQDGARVVVAVNPTLRTKCVSLPGSWERHVTSLDKNCVREADVAGGAAVRLTPRSANTFLGTEQRRLDP